MVFVFAGILPYYFKNEKVFCDALIIATLIQSVIVFISLSESGRMLVENIQNADIERYHDRVIGLGIAGATGSIYLFTGLIANAYMLLFHKKNGIYLVSFLVIFLAISLVARTGFYAALILFLFVNFYDLKKIIKTIKRLVLIILISIILGVSFNAFQNNDSINTELISYTIKRLDEIFSGSESKTYQSISKMNIPTLSFETTIGTGVRKGTTLNGEWIWHDSGYVQRYMGLGIVMAFFSYLSLFVYQTYLINKIKLRKKRIFFYLIVALMMIIEVKEPFIYTLAYPFVTIVLVKIAIKSEKYKLLTQDERRSAAV